MKRYRPISLRKVRTYSLSNRRSKVRRGALASLYRKGDPFKTFMEGLPDILAASDIKAVAEAILKAWRNKRPVVVGMGAHPIKVGLSPLIIDLIDKGIITAMAVNGSCMVHDFELAYAGKTSEDVAEALHSGRFGMAKETGTFINSAIKKGVKKGHGLGRSLGELIKGSDFRFKHLSIFGAAARKGIPVCVHVAMGTDITHMHPQADGASIGQGSMRDFRTMCSVAADLKGGVYINLGSAVILPEVFLKALTVAKNLGHKVDDITTVNMDFIQHYRARENVLKRPTMHKGASYALTGHHEIMLPLLAAAVIEGMEK
jgi:deoxyhypusine synthase